MELNCEIFGGIGILSGEEGLGIWVAEGGDGGGRRREKAEKRIMGKREMVVR